jgi:hypothetical protein
MYKSTWHHILQDSNFSIQRREFLKYEVQSLLEYYGVSVGKELPTLKMNILRSFEALVTTNRRSLTLS